MNRRLARIALVSLTISVACLLLGSSIARLSWAGERHRWWWPAAHNCGTVETAAAAAAGRSADATGTPGGSNGQPCVAKLAWDAGDSLEIDLPAKTYYQPGPKAEAIVTGDPDLVRHVRLIGGRLDLDTAPACVPAGVIVVRITGPAVANWHLNGSGDLNLSNISQDALRINVTGSGRVVANGTVQQESLRISGSGAADLRGVAAASVTVRTSGSGNAEITSQQAADIHVSGSGSVTLHGHPGQMHSEVSGSGRIHAMP
jgi:hypothetical protein